MLSLIAAGSSLVAPKLAPGRSLVAQRSAVSMGLFPEGFLKTVESLNTPADADEDVEEVCYLDEESEAGYSFKCGPLEEPSYPDWWYAYDWPAGSSQAAYVKANPKP